MGNTNDTRSEIVEFAPIAVPTQFYDYTRLFLASMGEKVSNGFIGAGKEFERRFPTDSDLDIEDDW